MTSNSWTLAQYGISITSTLIGIGITYYQFHQRKKNNTLAVDDNLFDFVFLKPMTLGLLIFVAFTVAELKLVNFSEQLGGNQGVNDLSNNLNKAYKEQDNDILTSMLDEKVGKLNTFATYAINNEKVLKIDKNSLEFLQSAYKIFQKAESDTEILATSYVEPSDWWKDTEGKDYLKVNYEFILRGGRITRIHLFKDTDELKFFEPIMKDEAKNGITVKYIFEKDIPPSYDLKQDIIIVKGALAGKLSLDQNRNAKSVSYYGSKEKIKECQEIFNQLTNLQDIKTIKK